MRVKATSSSQHLQVHSAQPFSPRPRHPQTKAGYGRVNQHIPHLRVSHIPCSRVTVWQRPVKICRIPTLGLSAPFVLCYLQEASQIVEAEPNRRTRGKCTPSQPVASSERSRRSSSSSAVMCGMCKVSSDDSCSDHTCLQRGVRTSAAACLLFS